jgi:hypothetical protein
VDAEAAGSAGQSPPQPGSADGTASDNGEAVDSVVAAATAVIPSITTDDSANESSRKDASYMSFPSIMHKDAFLIFRALCKLSMKGLHDDALSESSDMIAMQNKYVMLSIVTTTVIYHIFL